MNSRGWDIALAVVFLAAAVFALAWWIPNDTETGVLYEDRYSVEIGDAMAPTVLAIAIALVSLAIGISAVLRRDKPRHEPNGESHAEQDVPDSTIGLTAGNSLAISVLAAICAVSMALMVWSGPALVAIIQWFGSDIDSYRHVSDTPPYKYTGFVTGGLFMVFSLICWVEGRFSWRAAAIAAATVLALIMVYDLPFDSLLLPPNGSL